MEENNDNEKPDRSEWLPEMLATFQEWVYEPLTRPDATDADMALDEAVLGYQETVEQVLNTGDLAWIDVLHVLSAFSMVRQIIEGHSLDYFVPTGMMDETEARLLANQLALRAMVRESLSQLSSQMLEGCASCGAPMSVQDVIASDFCEDCAGHFVVAELLWEDPPEDGDWTEWSDEDE